MQQRMRLQQAAAFNVFKFVLYIFQLYSLRMIRYAIKNIYSDRKNIFWKD